MTWHTMFHLAGSAALVTALLAGCGDSGSSGNSGNSGNSGEDAIDRPEYQVPANGGQALEPGAWALTADGLPDMPLAVVDVPAGYEGGGPFFFGPGGTIGYWTVSGVYADPCHRAKELPDVGQTVGGLAEALSAQEISETTRPEPVSLGGYEGLYLELTWPKNIDYESCDEQAVGIWESDPGGRRCCTDEPKLERIWILDVDGQRVVLNNNVELAATDVQSDELAEVVETVRFVEVE